TSRNHATLAQPEMNHLPHRLGARPLLNQKQLSTLELLTRPAQTDNHLKRKDDFAVEVLVQAVVTTLRVVKHERCRPLLSVPLAQFQEIVEVTWIFALQTRSDHPLIGRREKIPIELMPKLIDNLRKRMSKILVLTATEAIPSHVYPAAKGIRVGIELP